MGPSLEIRQPRASHHVCSSQQLPSRADPHGTAACALARNSLSVPKFNLKGIYSRQYCSPQNAVETTATMNTWRRKLKQSTADFGQSVQRFIFAVGLQTYKLFCSLVRNKSLGSTCMLVVSRHPLGSWPPDSRRVGGGI
ncbi:hypothetical protein CEXT_472341 [Caerostris extrusa]|uniref:Uncharacterized protein n=1 Tax=Caerostris extrusa TaxID=172846 RepID=A0AAV4V9N0_CAEEX|nr:hypothetical protein CEXT_472341 [Caerostris extrusa]